MSTTQIFWSKDLTEANKLLIEAGFDCNIRPDTPSILGSIDAEQHDVGKDHFTDTYRDLFVGEAIGGWYVTSHIVGEFRGYRRRRNTIDHNHKILNVFGHGKTPVEAVQMFLTNFKSKRYNVGK
jgi:hypothetical protein